MTTVSPTTALHNAIVRAERTVHAYATQTPDIEWMLGSALHTHSDAVAPALRHLLIDLHLYLTYRNLPADTLWADAAEDAAAEWTAVHGTLTPEGDARAEAHD